MEAGKLPLRAEERITRRITMDLTSRNTSFIIGTQWNSKLLLLIVSVPPHPSSLRDGKFPRDEGVDLGVRGFLAAHADDQEVLIHGLTLLEGRFAAVPGKR